MIKLLALFLQFQVALSLIHRSVRYPTIKIRTLDQSQHQSRQIIFCEMKISCEKLQESKRKDWHVWKAADRLERLGLSLSSDHNELPEAVTSKKIIKQVILILRQWGGEWAGRNEWKGILNKSTLLHEVEESIVTLGFLMEFINSLNYSEARPEPLTIIDVCSGKGIFSMLASYIFRNNSRVIRIIMLDQADIKWNHVDIVNENSAEEKRPIIETWQCNLHEVDEVVSKLESIKSPIAMVGIHLCKTLSPSCIGIVNSMRTSKCPFFVLAPCCLPRAVLNPKVGKKSVIEVRQFETEAQKETRILAKKRRDAAVSRRSRPLAMVGQQDMAPSCWKCGMVGHLKPDCPSSQTSSRPQLIKPPFIQMDVSNVLDSEKPFDTYCTLLSTSIERKNVSIINTGLVNDKARHQKGNWNFGRKSIYIVST